MLYFYVFLIQFYKFVLFLKSITKLVKHCNKNDKIKACVVELETAFSRENLTKKFYTWVLYGLFWANPYEYAHIGPKWDRCRPRMVPDGSHITALLEKYEFICMYLFQT